MLSLLETILLDCYSYNENHEFRKQIIFNIYFWRSVDKKEKKINNNISAYLLFT